MNRYWKTILILAALLTITSATSVLAQQDFRFHWAPCPLEDEQGNPCPAAVEYEVYLSRDGGFDELLATVSGDTTFVLSAEPGIVHRMRVAGIAADGRRSIKSDWSEPIYFEDSRGSSVPLAAGLQQNYPNPFNPETRVVYGIPGDLDNGDRVQLDIFSLDGRRIRTLETERTPGWHEVVWDGTDDRGRVQSTGMYITRLVVGTAVETQKMTMLK